MFVWIAVALSCIFVSSIDAHNILNQHFLKKEMTNHRDDDCPRTTEQKLLSHESDCSLFYICLNGRAVLHKCPNGLHFNIRVSVCDFPQNAGCELETTSRPKGRIGGIADVVCPRYNGRETVLVPHATECDMYFMCDNGEPHLRSCQPGLHFNPSSQACDYPDSAGCETSVTKSPRDYVGGGDNSEIQCPAQNGVLPVLKKDPTDCSRFYICDNGKAHIKDCQAGLYFNTKVNACDYPANVHCESDVNSKNDRGGRQGKLPDVGDDSLVICPTIRSDETVLIANPFDCSKFFMCHGGQPHPRTCPSGLHFNRFSQECDYPSKAKCNALGLMLSVGVPSPFCPAVSGKIPIFYGHPTNCSIYYLCSNGLAYEFACPARLHFNLRQKICDYESIARCQAGKKTDP